MHYIQYEELCRLFIADKFETSIEEVKSVRIPSPTHPGLVKYENQIDLYWEDGNEVALYLNIADAKWRGSDNVQIGRAKELQFVRNDINNANKAILITNTGFDDGVKGVADKYGMGLHIVRPDFDLAILDPGLIDRKIIQTQLQELTTNGKPLYTFEVVHRAFDSGPYAEDQSTVSDKQSSSVEGYSNRMVRSHARRIVRSHANRTAPPSTPKSQRGQSQSESRGQTRGTPTGSTRSGPGKPSSRR